MATALVLSRWVSAAEAPPVDIPLAPAFAAATPRAPMIVGAGTHFGIGGDYGYDVEHSRWALAALGLTSFRDDLPWPDFKRAGPDVPGQMPPRLAAMMAATPARPLLILNFPHPAIDGGHVPLTPVGVAAYAGFARDVALTARPARPMFEIWNEWNRTARDDNAALIGEGSIGDARAAVHYVTLARAATAAIHAADPTATVLVGASGT
ncbi:MAG: hypothetical protein ACRCSO_07290, partial [Sphingomonas sp.]